MEKINNTLFWRWFFIGVNNEKPGLFKFLDIWLIFYIMISLIFSYLFKNIDIKIDNTLAITFMGVLIAVAMGWSGNILTLLNSDEIILLSKKYHGGMLGYVFSVQTAVLSLFLTIILWLFCYTFNSYILLGFCIFFSCISIRECWQLILLSHILTFARSEIVLRSKNQEKLRTTKTRSLRPRTLSREPPLLHPLSSRKSRRLASMLRTLRKE